MKKIVFTILLLFMSSFVYSKDYTISSPDSNLALKISAGKNGLFYSLITDGIVSINSSRIEMSINDGQIVVGPASDYKAVIRKKDETIKTFAYKCSDYIDTYNSITFSSKLFNVEFRLYDNGMAYRFSTNINGDIYVDNEIAEYNLSKDYMSYLPKYHNFPGNFSQESLYEHKRISEIGNDVMTTPLLVEIDNGHKLLFTESDLHDYPGLLMHYSNGLSALFQKCPSELYYHNNTRHVKSREKYIAKTVGKRTFPWRIIAYSQKDIDLPANNLVYSLAMSSKFDDTSWIHPGKSAWEWWSANTVYGVDFKVGFNTQTYKYYIDFARKYGLDYIIMDGDWSSGPMKPNPGIDIEEIASYARDNRVGVFLWSFSNLFYDDMENICKYYSDLGISGFKIDFIDRDDQLAVKMVEEIAEMTAKYHLMVDFHGIYKPTGLNRTYPNVIGFEGVFGLENYRWYKGDMVSNEVILPYIRMVAGHMDYTPGAMINASRKKYASVVDAPMSQGTRARQVAFYITYDASLGILSDGPANYIKEEETLKYIAQIPTTFNNTIPIDGKVGEYYVVARNDGRDWFVGGISSWSERDVRINLDFLDSDKTYQALIYKDGLNASDFAMDYIIDSKEVYLTDHLDIHMASGGGFAIIIKPID